MKPGHAAAEAVNPVRNPKPEKVRVKPDEGQEGTAGYGLLFSFSGCHVIISTTAAYRKESINVTNRKESRRTKAARIVALATAGVMILTIVLAVILK